ncbi:hypothetical protein ABFT80_26690 [Mesorhizobium sp. SB112]|uniref:HD domain-containing protein n=1 Tax=Mesorhizobium sp. SB112 TaxID=3151853 RepID=UPI003262D566
MIIKESSLEKTLEHLGKTAKDQFPEDHITKPFSDRYVAIAKKLNEDFHPNVLPGNISADGGLLTDHGPIHIRTVLNRAADLLNNPNNKNKLSGYEIYLLMCAIHFHDLGNALGREEHEKKIPKMMEAVKSHLGDSVEKSQIRKIAETHGGKIGDDPDTISYLDPSLTVFRKEIRPQALAAILRFADELADDSQRANRILQQLDAIPAQSEVFHKYAECLHSVNVRDECKSVELTFSVDAADLVKKFGKYNKETKTVEYGYILDEIFSRTLKMHRERIYCNRFMAPIVHVKSIIVRIQVSKPDEKIGESLPRIDYKLEDSGYPDSPVTGIYAIARELNAWGETRLSLNGERFAKFLCEAGHAKVAEHE